MAVSRNEILAAAQRALSADPAVSMTGIAGAAGVGRATLHRHFATREALLTELGTRSLDRWEQRLDAVDVEKVAAEGTAEEITETLGRLVRWYVADADDFGFALTDHVILTDADLVKRTELLAQREVALFAAGQQAGAFRRDVSARWFSWTVCGLLVAGRDAVRAGEVGRREAPELVLTSLLAGVGAR